MDSGDPVSESDRQSLPQIPAAVSARAWWAVDCAGQGLLIDCSGVQDALLPGLISPVPHAPPWLQGLTMLKGQCVGVIDLARYLGLAAPSAAIEAAADGFPAELLLLDQGCWPDMAVNPGRVKALVCPDTLQPQWRQPVAEWGGPGVQPPAFVRGAWRLDELISDLGWQARAACWHEIDLRELAKHPRSLEWPR